jgi:predicted amidophosphoribosyltransferase
MLEPLVALVVPPRCAACRAPGRRPEAVLCGACRRALPWLGVACCERCALPLPHRGACPARGAPFDAAWSAVAYEGPARDAMRALKFRAARPLADVMAAQIAANAPAELLRAPVARPPAVAPAAEVAVVAGPAGVAPALEVAVVARPPAVAPAAEVAVVAVPAHPARRRARGFDPAELLARALARRTGLPLAPALRRGSAPSRQLGASRDERRATGRLRFEARGAAPRTAILVDDVHTTGATLSACARTLKDAGAERVVALTWARTL